MAYALDSLGYAQHLRKGGVPQEVAEVHAEAAREFIMGELVTKEDLRISLDNQAMRILIQLGGFVAACIAALGAFIKLTA